MNEKQSMRAKYKAARRQLSPLEQKLAAFRIDQKISRSPVFKSSLRIAFYLPVNGELDPRPLMMTALRNQKSCYLPVIKAGSKDLKFVRYDNSSKLTTNRYGIPEPLQQQEFLRGKDMDLVIMPLVAFDKHGGRLGMGGGYYDKSFKFKQGSTFKKPVLAAIAHRVQQVNKVEMDPWDIKPDKIFQA